MSMSRDEKDLPKIIPSLARENQPLQGVPDATLRTKLRVGLASLTRQS